jgi:hypothetical protein
MSVICTTVMCSEGKARVSEMRRVFNILSGNPSFNQAKYEPSVLAIEQAFDDQYSLFSEWIPFNPACCAIKDIGAQADALTLQMQSAAGVGTTPLPVSEGFNLDTVVTLGGLALAAVLIGNLSALRVRR